MPKVSIIIPVYNIQDYLEQCLDSVIGQTLKDIEIILVDDGSTDESGTLCDEYASKDSRIRVIHKKNEGLSCARNDGIKIASAPYIMFVDGDDWVEPESCSLSYKKACEYDADLVLFFYNWISTNGTVVKREMKIHDGLLSAEEAIRYNVCFTSAVWIGLYRKELFDNIEFPAGKYYEDVGVSHRLIYASKRVCLLNSVLYNHRNDRLHSITMVPETRNHPDKKEMTIRKIKDLNSWGYERYAQKCAFSMLVQYGWRDQDQKVFVEIVNKMKWDSVVDFSWKTRIIFIAYKISPVLFDWICNLKGCRER